MQPDGVLTWDEPRVVHAARLAGALGLPGCTPESALNCRDKHATRTALAAAGVPQAASTLVTTLAEARAAADRIGYPLVLKARALGASIGVVRVEGPEQLADRFRIARGADVPTVTELPPGDVLVEEYLDGPEISVDAAWSDGAMGLAYVARKQIGYPPYFEEIGHLVDGADPLLHDARLAEVVAGAHAAVGYHTGWTHTELRLTPDGPKVVEINARIGGDRIPQLAEWPPGCGPPRSPPRWPAGSRWTSGRPGPGWRPSGSATRNATWWPSRCRIDRDRLPASVASAEVIAEPGQELLLPPAGHVPAGTPTSRWWPTASPSARPTWTPALAAVHLEVLNP